MSPEEILIFIVNSSGYILLLFVIILLFQRSIELQCFIKRLFNKKKNYGILDVITKDGKVTSHIVPFSQNEIQIGEDKLHLLPERVTTRNGMPWAVFPYNDALKELYHYDIGANLVGSKHKIDPEVLTNTLKIMLSRSAADPLLKAIKNLNLFSMIQIGILFIMLILIYVAMDNSGQALGVSKAILAKVVTAAP